MNTGRVAVRSIAWLGLGPNTSIDLSERNVNDPVQNIGSDTVVWIRIKVRYAFVGGNEDKNNLLRRWKRMEVSERGDRRDSDSGRKIWERDEARHYCRLTRNFLLCAVNAHSKETPENATRDQRAIFHGAMNFVRLGSRPHSEAAQHAEPMCEMAI